MKITFTLIFFICLQNFCFSQTASGQRSVPPPSYAIVIESLPSLSSPNEEISLDLQIQGTYIFKKAEGLSIPDNYIVLIKDKNTGNTFDLASSGHHSFSINRAMTKQFVLQVREVNPQKSVAITMK